MVSGNSRRHGVHAKQNPAGAFGIGNFQSIGLIEGDDQLEGVHGIQAHAAGAKQGLVVGDFFRSNLKHEVFHHEAFNVLFECGCIIH